VAPVVVSAMTHEIEPPSAETTWFATWKSVVLKT
jgi:hypothetical protein